MTKPIVIIGAGINGLVAAADLAAPGKSVQVFERGSKAGGALHTEALTLDGFRHDVAAMKLSFFSGAAFVVNYGAELAQHGLEFLLISGPIAQDLETGDYVGV